MQAMLPTTPTNERHARETALVSTQTALLRFPNIFAMNGVKMKDLVMYPKDVVLWT